MYPPKVWSHKFVRQYTQTMSLDGRHLLTQILRHTARISRDKPIHSFVTQFPFARHELSQPQCQKTSKRPSREKTPSQFPSMCFIDSHLHLHQLASLSLLDQGIVSSPQDRVKHRVRRVFVARTSHVRVWRGVCPCVLLELERAIGTNGDARIVQMLLVALTTRYFLDAQTVESRNTTL